MIANYHTHTWRCNHAEPGESRYVRAAMERGLKILGFSDHTPYPFPSGHMSTFRMGVDQLPGYCQCIQNLQKEYAGKIQIEIGLEAEYYPKYFSELTAILRDTPVTYLLLGQHFTGSETDGVYSGAPTGDIHILKAYCNQARDAMQTGLFTYFAHPDLVRFTGSDKAYRQEMSGLIREAKSCGIPLEINLLGLSDGRHYPSCRFLELAAQEGCPVILGCDAHEPAALLDTALEAKALAMIQQYGLAVLDTVPLRNIQKALG